MESSNPQIDTTLVDYENLQAPPELNQELTATLDAYIKGNWKHSFQCITMIRSICKFYPQYIPDIFMTYGPAVLNLLNKSTPLLTKNVLRLLMEIFSKGLEVNLEGCVQALLPPLVKKSAMDTCSANRESCQQILTVIATKCGYPNTLESKCSIIQ